MHCYKFLLILCSISCLSASEKTISKTSAVPLLFTLAQRAFESALLIDQHNQQTKSQADEQLQENELDLIGRFDRVEKKLFSVLCKRLNGFEYWYQSYAKSMSDDPCLRFVNQRIAAFVERIFLQDKKMQRHLMRLHSDFSKLNDYKMLSLLYALLENEGTLFSPYFARRLELVHGLQFDEPIAENEKLLIKDIALLAKGYAIVSTYPGKPYSMYMHIFATESDHLVRDDLRNSPEFLLAFDDATLVYAVGTSLHVLKAVSLQDQETFVFDAPLCCAACTDNRLIVVGLRSGVLCFFDPCAMKETGRYKAHQTPVTAIACCGNFVVSSDSTGTLQWYACDSNLIITTVGGCPSSLHYLSLINDDSVVAVFNCKDVRIYTRSTATFEGVSLELPSDGSLVHVQMHDGLLCYSNSKDDYIRFFDPLQNMCLSRVRCYSQCACFSLNNANCVLAQAHKRILVTRAKEWRSLLAHRMCKAATSVAECELLDKTIETHAPSVHRDHLLQKLCKQRELLAQQY